MSPKYKHIQEEELKNKVAHDWFSIYDTTQIAGVKKDRNYILYCTNGFV